MDLKTYNTILQARGENPHEIPDGTEKGDSRGHLAFRKDLIQNKVVWYNDPKADWHAFIRNYHPLYSICGAPKQHPFSRRERFFVFIAHNVLAAILSIFIAIVITGMEEDNTHSGTKMAVNTTLSCIAGLIKSLSNGLLKYMMVCPCCEKETCSSFCRKCWGAVGHCLLCLWYVVILFSLLIMVVAAVQENIFGSFIYSFIISNVSGWFFSLILLSCCFGLKWKKEKKNMDKLESKLRITYLDYEKYNNGESGVTTVNGSGTDLTVSNVNGGQIQSQQVIQPAQVQQQEPIEVMTNSQPQIVYVQQQQPIQPPQQYGQQYFQPGQPIQQQQYVQAVQQPPGSGMQIVYDVNPNQQVVQQQPPVYQQQPPPVYQQQQQVVQQVYVQPVPQQQNNMQQPHTTLQ